MEKIITKDLNKKIVKIKDTSDPYFSRMQIVFKNGYRLSVIRGVYSFGGADGLYETAPIGILGHLLHNELKGHQTKDDVIKEINRMAKYGVLDELCYWIPIWFRTVTWKVRNFFYDMRKKVKKVLDK